jgi:hypothetical protein
VRVCALSNYEAIGGFQVSGSIISIVARRNAPGPTLLAVGCVRSFEIVAFQPRRVFVRPPRSGDTHLLSLEWVADHLAVLWPDSLELYATDGRDAPAEAYDADGELLTSCVFLEHEGLTFAIVAFTSGKSPFEPILLGAGPTIRLGPTARWPQKWAGIVISAPPTSSSSAAQGRTSNCTAWSPSYRKTPSHS